jgi:hypothetical protein
MTHLSTRESIEIIGLLIFKNVLLLFLKNNKKEKCISIFSKNQTKKRKR